MEDTPENCTILLPDQNMDDSLTVEGECIESNLPENIAQEEKHDNRNSCETDDDRSHDGHVIQNSLKYTKCVTCNVKVCPECLRQIKGRAYSHFFLGRNMSLPLLRCDLCDLRFVSHCSYQAHSRLHMMKSPHVCPDCGTVYSSFRYLLQHMEVKCFHFNRTPVYKCTKCHQSRFSKLEMVEHVNNHVFTVCTCLVCKQVIKKGRKNGLKHVRTEHNATIDKLQYRNVCRICNLSIEKNLSAHSLMHVNNMLSQANILHCPCGFMDGRKKAFRKHNDICSERTFLPQWNYLFESFGNSKPQYRHANKMYQCSSCQCLLFSDKPENQCIGCKCKNTEPLPNTLGLGSEVTEDEYGSDDAMKIDPCNYSHISMDHLTYCKTDEFVSLLPLPVNEEKKSNATEDAHLTRTVGSQCAMIEEGRYDFGCPLCGSRGYPPKSLTGLLSHFRKCHPTAYLFSNTNSHLQRTPQFSTPVLPSTSTSISRSILKEQKLIKVADIVNTGTASSKKTPDNSVKTDANTLIHNDGLTGIKIVSAVSLKKKQSAVEISSRQNLSIPSTTQQNVKRFYLHSEDESTNAPTVISEIVPTKKVVPEILPKGNTIMTVCKSDTMISLLKSSLSKSGTELSLPKNVRNLTLAKGDAEVILLERPGKMTLPKFDPEVSLPKSVTKVKSPKRDAEVILLERTAQVTLPKCDTEVCVPKSFTKATSPKKDAEVALSRSDTEGSLTKSVPKITLPKSNVELILLESTSKVTLPKCDTEVSVSKSVTKVTAPTREADVTLFESAAKVTLLKSVPKVALPERDTEVALAACAIEASVPKVTFPRSNAEVAIPESVTEVKYNATDSSDMTVIRTDDNNKENTLAEKVKAGDDASDNLSPKEHEVWRNFYDLLSQAERYRMKGKDSGSTATESPQSIPETSLSKRAVKKPKRFGVFIDEIQEISPKKSKLNPESTEQVKEKRKEPSAKKMRLPKSAEDQCIDVISCPKPLEHSGKVENSPKYFRIVKSLYKDVEIGLVEKKSDNHSTDDSKKFTSKIVLYKKINESGNIFSSGQEINSDRINNKSSNYCALCKKQFNTVFELRQHFTTHPKNAGSYQCMECGDCFMVLPTLTKHLRAYHKIDNIDAYLMEHNFIPGREDISKREEKPVKVENSKKNENFDSEKVNDKETACNIQCNVCKEIFTSTTELDMHFRKHGMAFLQRNRKDVKLVPSP